LHTIQIIHQ